MADMNYIKKKFLKYTNIVSWCKSYAKENGYKLKVEVVDHNSHERITMSQVARMLHNAGIPSYRNSYNLRSFDNEKAIFYLTVKGMSIVIICSFIIPDSNETVNGYKVDRYGQLSFI